MENSRSSCILLEINRVALYCILVLLLFNTSYGYEWGDTLTIIQKPILNIPEIIAPGDTFTSWLKGGSEEIGWSGRLMLRDLIFDLQNEAEHYDADFGIWRVTFRTDSDMPLELYDLIVNRDAATDTTRHSVSITENSSEYTFAVICDSHIPTIGFWNSPEPDSSVTSDMEAVLADLQIINPKFILHLGDLVDQGYLEDYQARHYMGRAQAVLSQCSAPIYVIAGNHDVGGCSTPNSPFTAGTGRRNWWNYFGWKWLENPPDGHYTQDYTFNYGGDLYIGMESYEQYDHWLNSIYGYYSFCGTAWDWLNQQLESSVARYRILFTHWDYQRQLDAGELGLNGIFYGHLHINYGDIYSQPFAVSPEGVCEHFKSPYGRGYMTARISSSGIEILPTLYAGGYGEKLSLQYIPDNSGQNQNVDVIIENHNDVPFYDAMIKVNMPANSYNYVVAGAAVRQIIDFSDFRTIYLAKDLSANSMETISINSQLNTQIKVGCSPKSFGFEVYPNPGNSKIVISFSAPLNSPVRIRLYTTTGELVRDVTESFTSGENRKSIDCSGLTSGIYYVKLESAGYSGVIKTAVIK